MAGIIVQKTKSHYVAFSPLLGADKPFKVKSKTALKEGDRIICKVLTWHNESEMVEGELVRLIGHISDPSIDIQAAIEEFELPDGFTKEAVAEAQSFGKRVNPKGRRDITEWEVVTIDPDTANPERALDVHVSRLRKKLGVAGTQVRTVYKIGYRLDERPST